MEKLDAFIIFWLFFHEDLNGHPIKNHSPDYIEEKFRACFKMERFVDNIEEITDNIFVDEYKKIWGRSGQLFDANIVYGIVTWLSSDKDSTYSLINLMSNFEKYIGAYSDIIYEGNFFSLHIVAKNHYFSILDDLKTKPNYNTLKRKIVLNDLLI